jgi:transcriptional regulator with XRE-family HTH domain
MRVAELAREAGVTPSLISQIERGQSRPSVSSLFAIAQALGVPVDAFFREPAGPQPAVPSAAEPSVRTRPEPESSVSTAEPPLSAGEPPRTEREGRYVVRRDGRAAIDIEGGVRWERLTPQTLPHLEFFQLVYGPYAESHPTPYTHPGTEVVLVTEGVLDITLGFDRYRLHPGDSMQMPSTIPHRYVNPGAETTRAVTVILYDCPASDDPLRLPLPE